ncbi:hypothetical protein BCR35DRAFT_297088 [Leucosporidium creatinivorum]|uniref:DUF1996 domain-containing protein n=1 Tax=Leucosporidium creatinivorum TaxID=106004 RepID=A0A1Y2CQH7_9BASI|nr:hypothetical protein BCR35DRAFT_297088 [Leucosporidium creatinivorum]
MLRLCLLLTFARAAHAFWRLPCANPLVVERVVNPLTNPGTVSGHVHSIAGGSNFNLNMDFDTARASQCTSCQVKQDMSNYWTPNLYFAFANGTFAAVDAPGPLVYYLPRKNNESEVVKAFPDGYRMLAGDPYTRTYDGSDMAKAIGWNCLGGKQEPTRNPWLPTENCPTGLRGEIMFPSCWNGVDVDSSSHQSHVAYPIGGESGPCPAGFPVRTVTIFYEIWLSTDPWKDLWDQALNTTQPFVTSQGDPTGYSWHDESFSCSRPVFSPYIRDFNNAWDGEVLQNAIDECTDDSGVIEKCTIFDLYDYSDLSSNRCQQTSFIDEQVEGLLTALPGNNPYTPGPDRITMLAEDSPPSINGEVTVFGGAVANHTVKANTDGSSDGGSTGGSSSAGGGASATNGSSATKGTSAAATGTGTAKAEASSTGSASSGGSSGGSSSSESTSSEDDGSSSASSDLPLGLSALQWGLVGGGFIFLIMGAIM